MNPVLPVEYLLPLLAALLALGAFSGWRSTEGVAAGTRAALLVCRLAALAALAVVAFNPGAWRREVRNENSEWSILLDRSASMATKDAAGDSRWRQAQAAGRAAAQMAADPRAVAPFTFSDRLERRFDLRDRAAQSLVADGASSDIVGSLQALFDRYEGGARRLAGVLLLSDGRNLGRGDWRTAALRARAMDAPVYALPIGGSVVQRDLVLTTPRRMYVAFAGQKLNLIADLENRNLGRITATVRLRAADGAELGKAAAAIEDNALGTVSFPFTADQEGYRTLRVEAETWPGEVSANNNAAEVGVSVLADRINVLFIEGSPHWDSKFLVQLLRREPHLKVTTVHRVTGERFFRVETEQEQSAETATAFPEQQADLNRYDAVAFGKGVEYCLTPERIAMLRAYVQERGGVLLFCRGKPYFGALPELESLEPVEWGPPARQALRWRPAPAGEKAGLVGALLPGAAEPIWSQLPEVAQASECPTLRSFAQVLLSGAAAGSETRLVPVLISRRIGQGLSVAVNSEGLWRWDFFAAKPETAAFYKEFWVELVQWAVVQSDFLPGRRLAARVEPTSVLPGVPVKTVVYARAEGANAAAAPPELRVCRGATVVETVALRAASPKAGEWSAVFALDEPGAYRIEASLPRGDGQETAYAALEVRAPPGELMELSADPDFLKGLAEESGGRLVAEGDLAEVARLMAPREVAADTGATSWQSRWDRAWLLLLTSGLLATEWFLRRRNGLL